MAKQPKTAYFQGAGGVIQEMDLPLSEVMAEQVEKGTLRPVNAPVKAVVTDYPERAGGSITRLVLDAPDPDDEDEADDVDPEAVPVGTIADVLAWAKADPGNRALKALMVEEAKGDKARKNLVTALSELLAA